MAGAIGISTYREGDPMSPKKIPYIEQMEDSECGLACLAMVLNFYNYRTTLSTLRDEYGSTSEGLTFYHLAAFAQSKKLFTKGYKLDIDDLKNLTLPTILHWKGNHFVVLEKIKRNRFYIVDPAKGRTSLDKNTFSKYFTGNILSLEPSPDFTINMEKESDNKILKHFIKEKRFILSIFFITLLIQGLSVSVPLITSWFTDEILVANYQSTFIITGVIIGVLFFTYILLSILRGCVVSFFQTRLDSSIMNAYMNTLFKLPLTFFENRNTGELLFRTNSNVYIRQVLSSSTITIFIDIILVITYFFIMFTFSIPLSLILLGISIFITALLFFNTSILKKLNDKNVSNQAKVQSILSDSINGILDVKIHGLESKMHEQWKEKFDLQLAGAQQLNIWSSSIQSITTSIQFIISLFILWIGSYYVSTGEITFGTLVAFSTISISFINPIVSLSQSYTQILSLGAYFRRIFDVIKSKTETINNSSKLELQGAIELRDVSFKYNKFGKNVLNNISLNIAPGEKIAFVGPSGSGKSTLAKILLGVYKPSDGEIYYDNKNVEELNITDLRTQIGSVMQDSSLFNRTIMENISMMQPDITLEEVVAASIKANIYNEIMALPLNFETIISENGMNFSGGQVQRLQIARALVRKKPILIFDEATSALDTISEKVIDSYLNESSCTRVIIAHRLSTVINADRIYVLSNGEIQEFGTHEELIKKHGHYYQLYNGSQNSEDMLTLGGN